MIAEASATATQTPARRRFASLDRRVFLAAGSITAAGVVVKVAAAFKEVTVAAVFGRSDAMDAFLAAFLIPNLLINLIAESMNQALIPTLIRVRLEQGRDRAQELVSSSMFWLCTLLTGAAFAMAAGARAILPLIASNFPAAKVDLAIRLFYVLLPCVILGGIASQCTAVLNSRERFALPALAPAIVPLSVLAATLIFHGVLGIWTLAFATVAGCAFHAAIVGGRMRSQGYAFRLRRSGANEASREVARQWGPLLLSSAVASAGLLVDQGMAAMLPAGSVSTLVYGGRFVGLAVALMAGAISSAVAPYFSTLVAQKDWVACRDSLRGWARRAVFVSVPIALAFIVGAHLLVRITLQHGAFAAHDTAVVARVLAMYAIQIPFITASRVFYRFVIAMHRTDIVLYCGGVNLILDVIMNVVLMRWMGVAGIALSTSLWSIATFVFLWYWSRRLLEKVSPATAEERYI